MAAGIVFVIAGILLFIYPPLLSIIVASVMIFTGIFLFNMSRAFKKASRKFNDPFIDFFFKV